MCTQVTFLGVSKKFTICQEAKQVNTKQNLHFECLEPHHFVPEIVETYPYEQLSHAVLNWVEENADRCDVIHGHEWGGAFVDLITANNYRQVRRECTFQSMLAVFEMDACPTPDMSCVRSGLVAILDLGQIRTSVLSYKTFIDIA